MTDNQAFIDGQNLYMNTRAHGWQVDLARFRVYLRDKYQVDKAYYFLGALQSSGKKLYERIKAAGFILVFREHSRSMLSQKKGNVDTDIVFAVMHKIAECESFGQVVLVSGDGDYIKMVKYLLSKNKLKKVLAPNKKSMSSLYRSLTPKYTDFLDRPDIKRKLVTKKAGSS